MTNAMSSIRPWEQLTLVSTAELDSEELRLGDDPIALSVASHRQFVNSGGRTRWAALESQTPSTHDRDVARDLRTHYKGALTVRGLKGPKLTPFQRDLYELLSTERFTKKHLGMVYRLPYFYQEDQQRAQITREFPHWPGRPLANLTTMGKETRYLQLIEIIFKSRRSSEVYEYWFGDTEGQPCMWAVQASSPLRSLVDSIIRPGHVKLRASWHVLTNRYMSMPYYQVGEPELAA